MIGGWPDASAQVVDSLQQSPAPGTPNLTGARADYASGMKQSKQCPKCMSLRIGFLDRQVDRGSGDTSGRHAGVGRETTSQRTGFVGRLEAYVCTDCGYFESYVSDAEHQQWDTVDGFRWLNAEAPAAGPYR